jgi:hypothetical protein
VGKVKAFGGRLKDFSHSSFHRMINKAKESGKQTFSADHSSFSCVAFC